MCSDLDATTHWFSYGDFSVKISCLANLTTNPLSCLSKRLTHIFGCHMSKTTILFSRIWLAVDFWRHKLCEISVQICNLKNWTPVTFKLFFSVLFALCFRARLFIDALWSLAWKGLTSWLSFVMSNCEVITFQLVSWVRCGLDCIDSWPSLSYFHVFPRDNIRKPFTLCKQSDTLSFALLDCIILHINNKQFRCSVFTFV